MWCVCVLAMCVLAVFVLDKVDNKTLSAFVVCVVWEVMSMCVLSIFAMLGSCVFAWNRTWGVAGDGELRLMKQLLKNAGKFRFFRSF